jgi:hypothetical protein
VAKKQTVSQRTLFWTKVLGIPTLAVAILVPGLEHLHNYVRTETSEAIKTAIEPLNTRLSKIEGELELIGPFVRSKIAEDLSAIFKQPAKELTENLPRLQQTLRAARVQCVNADADTLIRLSKSLSKANPQDPNYWPATAEFSSTRCHYHAYLPAHPALTPREHVVLDLENWTFTLLGALDCCA